MSGDINVQATSRKVFGKGASRRLRRDDLVPAILYGDDKEPQSIQLKHNEVIKHLQNEQFYSQLLSVSVDGGEASRCILRDVQRHPFRQQILHMDFLAVKKGAELQLNVPLHFVGEEDCPGVKEEAGIISHNENDVAIACLPRDIPEHIAVDMSQMRIGDTIHLSQLTLPENVRLVDLQEAGDDSDRIVASVNAPRVEVEPEADDIGDEAVDGGQEGAAPSSEGGDESAAEDNSADS